MPMSLQMHTKAEDDIEVCDSSPDWFGFGHGLFVLLEDMYLFVASGSALCKRRYQRHLVFFCQLLLLSDVEYF